MAHYPIIWKEMDQLLTKAATEPLFGGTGICSNVFVIHKCTVGL